MRQPIQQIPQRVLIDLVPHFIFAPGRLDSQASELRSGILRVVDCDHGIPRSVNQERRERSARFVWAYSAIWCVETILDPLCTGPLTGSLDLGDSFLGTVIPLVMLLSDGRLDEAEEALQRLRQLGYIR